MTVIIVNPTPDVGPPAPPCTLPPLCIPATAFVQIEKATLLCSTLPLFHSFMRIAPSSLPRAEEIFPRILRRKDCTFAPVSLKNMHDWWHDAVRVSRDLFWLCERETQIDEIAPAGGKSFITKWREMPHLLIRGCAGKWE